MSRSHGVALAVAFLLPIAMSCSDGASPSAPTHAATPAPQPAAPVTPVAPVAPGAVQPTVPTTPDCIFVRKPDGTLSGCLARGGWPQWSPDGRLIAYHRDGTVFIMNAAGTEVGTVSGAFYPAWSPDGTRLVASTHDGIAVMNTDGSNARTLVLHGFRTDTYRPWDMGIGKPAWSPDGKRIAFEHFGDGDMTPAQVFVMNADGSDVHRVSMNGDGRYYAESDPSWSPDGSKVIYWSYGFGIAVTDAAGGEPASLYRNFPTVAYGARPVWSARGILFNTFPYASSSPVPRSDIWLMPTPGAATTMIVSNAYHASWSPDGSVAFVSARQP